MAGRDEGRLDDISAALQDPEIRALICLRGGVGSLRLTHGVDVAALRTDPKPLVGFSDVTALLQVWHRAGATSLHGGLYGDRVDGARTVLFGGTPAPVSADPMAFGASVGVPGTATGLLFGGNFEMLAGSVGVVPIDLGGHVLLLENFRSGGLGTVDRALTQLIMSGALQGITGVAVGAFTGYEEHEDGGWTVLDLLQERLCGLDVPVLAGLPFGHLTDPVTLPLGVECTLDTADRTVTFAAALR